jgi:hypothetical protein
MKKLESKSVLIALTILVVMIFAASYFSFQKYTPKALQEVREVRGYQTQNTTGFDLPVPRYAKSLGTDQTLNSKSFTFQTDRSPEEIQKFYENILQADDWKLKKEGSLDNFSTTKYRKDDLSVTIWASYDKDTKLTFASVEILRFE